MRQLGQQLETQKCKSHDLLKMSLSYKLFDIVQVAISLLAKKRLHATQYICFRRDLMLQTVKIEIL